MATITFAINRVNRHMNASVRIDGAEVVQVSPTIEDLTGPMNLSDHERQIVALCLLRIAAKDILAGQPNIAPAALKTALEAKTYRW